MCSGAAVSLLWLSYFLTRLHLDLSFIDIAKQHSARFNFFEWGGKDVGGTQRKIGRPDPIFIPIFRETPCVRRSPELGGIYASYYKLTLAQRNTRGQNVSHLSIDKIFDS